jgi:hypothetical protein
MRFRFVFVLAVVASLFLPRVAAAQDVGIVESAETINKGNFKIRVNPLVIFGKDGEDSRTGIAALAGYGLTSRFDFEGGAAFFDGVTFLAANAEFWVIKEKPFDFSIAGGIHSRFGDATADLKGIDLTFLASGHVNRNLEVYGGLDLAFEGIGDPPDFKTIHIVPGIEYRINDTIDFVAEFGIAVNDFARHYFTGGIAIYFR